MLVTLCMDCCSTSPETMSPGARNSRVFALENMLATSSSTLVSMASQLSEAEERERVFCSRGRWNQVRSLAEAKNVMNYLFNLASSSRCMVRDKEIDCREKDSEIKELKEKVVKLNSFVRQLEKQNAELVHQVQQKNTFNGEGRIYDLRQGPRASFIFKSTNMQQMEDMDTSDSEHSNSDEDSADEWVPKKKNSRKGGRSGSESHSLDTDDGRSLKTEGSGSADTVTSRKEEPKPSVCCTCSKQSSCKTLKCECRAFGGSCSTSCGCSSNKCSNREGQKTDDIGHPEAASDENGSADNDDLATRGAALLESALSEMPGEQTVENGARRKPLADIGNTAAKLNAPRPNRRKTWRKSVVQLVPTVIPALQPENVEQTRKPESSTAETNIPLRLPRAMRSAASSNSLLRDRNAEQGEQQPGVNKESGDPARRSPVRRVKKSDEKENLGL